ncbi:MAG: GHKL domain-containing protein [Lachnospiraceae bacterium]|nr:GHKL domain-containing protein [Lachnospiraceae bacterium]
MSERNVLRRIDGKFQIKNGRFLIQVENTCRRNLLSQEPDRPRRPDGAGIGVLSIERTVEKYGVSWTFMRREGSFP